MKFQLNHIYQTTDRAGCFDFIFEVISINADFDFIHYSIIAGTLIANYYSDSFHVNSHIAACAALICHADDLHLYPELLL